MNFSTKAHMGRGGGKGVKNSHNKHEEDADCYEWEVELQDNLEDSDQ